MKILIHLPNWLGDCLLALAAVIEKKRRDPAVEVTLLAPPPLDGLCALLAPFPLIAYRRSTSAERRETLGRVKEGGFDALMALPRSFSSAWFAFHTGIRRRRGVAAECRGILLTEALPAGLASRARHLLHEYAAVLDSGDMSPEKWTAPLLSPPDAAVEEERRGAVVFCPGARYGKAKQWPHFAALAGLIDSKGIVVLGDAADAAEGERIAAEAAGPWVENLAGKTTLPRALAIIAGASCVVSNDSGLMHAAGFLGAPLVALFGSTAPAWTAPLGKRSTVLYTKEPCSPCFKRTCGYGHYNCLNKISAEQVFEEMKKM